MSVLGVAALTVPERVHFRLEFGGGEFGHGAVRTEGWIKRFAGRGAFEAGPRAECASRHGWFVARFRAVEAHLTQTGEFRFHQAVLGSTSPRGAPYLDR